MLREVSMKKIVSEGNSGPRVSRALSVRHFSRLICSVLLTGLLAACVTDGAPISGQVIDYAKDYMEGAKYRPYKVMAVHDFIQSGGLAWGRKSPDDAIATAMGECKRRSTGVPCDLYAIGDTVVHGMTAKQIEEIKQRYLETASILRLLGSRAQEGFAIYSVSTKPDFKAFAVDRIGGGYGFSYACWDSKSTINRALQECKKRAGRDCEIYALGSRVVFGVTPEELGVAIREADKKSSVDPKSKVRRTVWGVLNGQPEPAEGLRQFSTIAGRLLIPFDQDKFWRFHT
jgi:hypothetical protein